MPYTVGMTSYSRTRRFLGLTQSDLSQATGVAVQRISLGERGLITFNYAEQALIENYLKRKLIQFQSGYGQHGSEASLEVAYAAN